MEGGRLIHVYYQQEGTEHVRTFPDKKRAFRWFHYLCPVDEAQYVEEQDGVRSAPKRLRRRPRRTPPASCPPGSAL